METPPALGGKDSLLLIDTPGFGDTRGLSFDVQTVDELRAFFTSEVNYLHAVSFVVKGTETRLDTRNRWIFDQVLNLFGRDISEIITLLLTFSDAAEPPGMAVVKNAKIEFQERFKLNNSAFFLAEKGSATGDYGINKMFWSAGNTALDNFAKFVISRKGKSLQETRDVMSRREELKARVESLRVNIDLGLRALDQLDTTIPEINKMQTLIESNKDFEIEVTEIKRVKRKKVTRHNSVCMNCLWTCHTDCAIGNNDDKMRCCAMDKSSGSCACCPKKCHWSDHQNLDYFYERVPIKKKKQTRSFMTDTLVLLPKRACSIRSWKDYTRNSRSPK